MRRRLTLTAAPATVTATATDTDRAISGLALPYGVPGRTSAGTVTVRPGSIRVPAELRRVKLFTEHGRRRPVGYAIRCESTAAGLSMSFRAAGTPDGDLALLEAAEGVRDALSVELDNVEFGAAGELTAADLVAVALTAVPAFAEARLVASDETTEDDAGDQAADADPDNADAGDSDDAEDEDEDDAGAAGPTPGGSTVPASRAPATLNARRRAAGTMTAARMLPRLEAIYRAAHDASELNAALSDVVPANDVGEGWLRFQWLGELWTPSPVFTDYTAAIGAGTLTGTEVKGWRWKTRPAVATYGGNKTPIPSNPVETEPASAPVNRLAGGWDVDRIYVDLGSAGFIEALFSAAIADLAIKQADYVGAALFAAAPASPLTADSAITGVTAAAQALTAKGATPSFIALSSDLWSDYLVVGAADAPWWLAGSSTVSLRSSNGSVSDLRVFVDPGLPAATVLAGDRRAATYYTAKPDPVRVQAVNVPNGGIDIAVFSYQSLLVNNSDGLVKQAVTVVP